MKYLTKRIICAAGCLLMLTSVASAHPGQTDADGGHWDNDTGEYHYHHGYPAHQHTNGICPYDYDDQTGRNSGTSGSSATDTISQDTTSDQVDDVDWRDPSWEWVPIHTNPRKNFSNSGSCPQAGHIIPRQYYYDADGRMYTPYQDQAIPHADGETITAISCKPVLTMIQRTNQGSTISLWTKLYICLVCRNKVCNSNKVPTSD